MSQLAKCQNPIPIQSGEYSKCPINGCNKQVLKSDLKVHVTKVHLKTMNKSSCRGKKQHLKNHTCDKLQSIRCPQVNCNKTFPAAGNLNEHLWVSHSTPIPCPVIDCDKVLKKQYLLIHMKKYHRNHILEKTRCLVCHSLVANIYFNQHMRLFHENKTTSSRVSRKSHIRSVKSVKGLHFLGHIIEDSDDKNII